MIIGTICVHGVRALTVSAKPIPRGIIGAQVQFEYADPMWDGLSKTVVFRAGDVTKDVLNAGEVVEIPPEVVEEIGEILKVGVYGEGIPTLWADLGRIRDATDPSGDESTDPSLPVWAQLQEQIDDLKENGSPSGGGGKPGENGGYYTPSVKQPDSDTLQFNFTPSKADMPAIDPVEFELPVGPKGERGETGPVGPAGPQGQIGPVGPKGDDYVLTDADKTEIAELAAKLVEVPDSGGNVDQPTVTPQMFGAVGDGVADDSDAIQAALNVGGSVYIPSGRYKITKTLTIGSNTSLVGDGEGTVIFLGDDGSNLTPHYWYAEDVEPNYPNYYPYITTQENAHSVRIGWLRVEGNTETASSNIHVGIAAESATDVLVEHVSVWKVNYFPELAPPRPSGQHRTGWNIAFLRCKRVELASSVVQYGGYECVRVGPNTESAWVHDSLIEYGWRTGFQIIRGCKHIVFERCIINQDDFDAYDTNACFTLHSSEEEHIKDILIRDCELTGKLFFGTAGGGAINQVYTTTDVMRVENTTICVVNDGLPCLELKGSTFIDNCDLSSVFTAIVAENTADVVIKDSDIVTTHDNKPSVISYCNMDINQSDIDSAFVCVRAESNSANNTHLAIKDSVIHTSNQSANAIHIKKTASSEGAISFEIVGNRLDSKIYLEQVGGAVSRKSTIADNTINPASNNRGIHAPSTATTEYKLLTVRDNIVTQGKEGILLNSAGPAVIMGNEVSGCTTGISATNERNIIKDNILPAST